ncbi:MAG TPA: hypothetical protein P5523_03780, partial [Bacteroidales bacterium]|nr:hypothetical protein [Bacteroidales bacterium]
MPTPREQAEELRRAGFTEEEIRAQAPTVTQTQTVDPTSTAQAPTPKLERPQIKAPGSEWLNQVNELRTSGFTDTEITNEQLRQQAEMEASGFTKPEIDEYFGVRTPDMTAVKEYAVNNFKKIQQENPQMATSIYDAFVAGLQESVVGLAARQKAPNVVLPQDAPRYLRITKGITEMAADWPVMAAGALGGATAGTAVGGPVGTFVGGAGTAFAFPTALRKIMMDHYERGDIQNAADFWDRLSSTVIETGKDFTIGVVTGGAGKAVKTLAPIASPLGKTSAALATEAATMTTAGAALEGHLPNSDEFIDGAIMALGFHGAVSGASKFRNSYSKSNMRPHEVLREMEEDPSIKGDLFSINKDVPEGIAKYAPKEAEVKPPPLPEPKAPTYSEPTQKILSQVGEKLPPEAKKVFDFNTARQDWIDKYDPIKLIDEQAYTEFRQAVDYKAKARHFFEFGTTDFFTGEKTGKSLEEILRPVRNNTEELGAYLISKRAIELDKRGIKSGFDLEAANKVIEEYKGKYDTVATELVDFQNRALDYLNQSGVLSDTKLKAFKEANKNYIPFRRILEASDLEAGKKQGKGAGSLKAIKGSEKQIQNPFTSILENTETMMQLAEKNRGIRTLIEGQEGIDSVFEKVPEKTKAIQVTDKEMEKALKSQNIEEAAKGFEIFRKEQNFKLNDNEFAVYKDGKREIYKTDPEIAAAVKALDNMPRSQNLFLKAMRGITALKKVGISNTVEYQVNNIIRDQAMSGVTSKYGTVPFRDILSAMEGIIGKSPEYQKWLLSGGANSSFIELNNDYLYRKLLKQSGESSYKDTAWNVVKSPLEALGWMGSLAENATRFAEFKRATKSGESLRQAGMASRDISLDFQRVGLKTEAVNGYIAYLNAGIQGADKLYTSFKTDPTGTSIRALTYITIPSIIAWLTNKDDPDYKEIPAWQKANYMIVGFDWWSDVKDPLRDLKYVDKSLVREKDGVYQIKQPVKIRIPYAEGLGQVYGALPVMMLDNMYNNNPTHFGKVFDALIGKLTPNYIPDLATPVIEQFANKSLFTGGPIVPSYAEKLLPEEQVTPYTSVISKMLGKAISYIPGIKDAGVGDLKFSSPAVIDNYIKSWTGSAGGYILQAVDEAVYQSGAVKDLRPEKSLNDYPFVKAFLIRHPSARAQSITDFQEQYRENKRVYDTMKFYASTGQVDKMNEVYDRYSTQIYKLDGLAQSLNNVGTTIRKYEVLDLDKTQ